jgi:tetratricopeptide (TPR) repeat protein
VWAYKNRGNAYNKKGEHGRAIADYTRAIELDPDFAAAYTARAWLRRSETGRG